MREASCMGGSTVASVHRDKPTAVPSPIPTIPPSSRTLHHPHTGDPQRVGELTVVDEFEPGFGDQ